MKLRASCYKVLGHGDFDPDRIKRPYSWNHCPVKGCERRLQAITVGVKRRSEIPVCVEHGIRLHSGTFVYWNGPENETRARLRNFLFRPDVAEQFVSGSVQKAENSRLGYEMSEDALSWNVFVALLQRGSLRRCAEYLIGRDAQGEPELYLWGTRIDLSGSEFSHFGPLATARSKLERGISRFLTEPDIMLVVPERLVVCIEAKFGSGNPVAHSGRAKQGTKPTDPSGLRRRYYDPAGKLTKNAIDPLGIRDGMHSQLFRNLVFASEMAGGADWHVVNLISATQWGKAKRQGAAKRAQYSFQDPTPAISACLSPGHNHRFTFRSWEGLFDAVIRDDSRLADVADYLRAKSAHFLKAFDLV